MSTRHGSRFKVVLLGVGKVGSLVLEALFDHGHNRAYNQLVLVALGNSRGLIDVTDQSMEAAAHLRRLKHRSTGLHYKSLANLLSQDPGDRDPLIVVDCTSATTTLVMSLMTTLTQHDIMHRGERHIHVITSNRIVWVDGSVSRETLALIANYNITVLAPRSDRTLGHAGMAREIWRCILTLTDLL